MILKLQWLVNIYTHPNQIPGYAPADWLTDWLIDWQWMPITYTSVAMGSVPVKGGRCPQFGPALIHEIRTNATRSVNT